MCVENQTASPLEPLACVLPFRQQLLELGVPILADRSCRISLDFNGLGISRSVASLAPSVLQPLHYMYPVCTTSSPTAHSDKET